MQVDAAKAEVWVNSTPTASREGEQERVVEWRLRELLRAGYPQESARELAARLDVDLHVATALVRAGCPAETALRVLR